jgi:precorrin-8X/cobalt-precorrin-8 methylmutase
VICTLDDPRVPDLARDIANTRTAAAMELWCDRLGGAVVAIGNAPTALFRLLEMLDAGAPLPAAVIGMPVGFVGAAESKDALIADARVPFVTVRGRKGGSAMSAAAINALASERE